jgi:hypothetical protein
LFQQPGFIDELREAPDSDAAYDVICAADEKVGTESA